MTYIETLRKNRESKASALHLFLLNFSKTAGHIHAFFEGNDDSSFYTNFIANFSAGMPIEVYKCGNKRSVYEVYSQIEERATQSVNTLFFVDKDFSDILHENWPDATGIYVTDYYSIENYILTEQMLERVWSDILHSPYNREALEEIKEKFNIQLSKFYEFMLPITAQILYDRECGGQQYLSNIKISKLCKLSDNLELKFVKVDEALALFERHCSLTVPTEVKIEDHPIFSKLLPMEPKKYVRGKYELAFFVLFISTLVESFKGERDQYGNNIRVSTMISDSNALEVLGPRVTIPNSLRQYLESNLQIVA